MEVMKLRLCMQCGQPEPELSETQRVCIKCHKREAEARARPFTETNVQRRASILNHINGNFDEELIERMRSSREFDNEKREERKNRISERRYKHEMAKFDDKLPDKPMFSLDKVMDFRVDILQAFRDNDCIGAGFNGKNVRGLSNDVSRIMGVDSKLLYYALTAYSSDYFSNKDATLLSNRLAGNYLNLRKNIPLIELAKGSPVEEWALIHVVGVSNNFIDSRKVPGFNMVSEVLTGVLAGQHLVSGYAMQVCGIFSKKLGIKQADRKYFTPKMLTQMSGWGFLVPERDNTIRPRSLDTTPKQQEINRKLVEHRLDITKCPKNYKPNKYSSCLECPLGYSKSNVLRRCNYAVRRDSLSTEETTSNE